MKKILTLILTAALGMTLASSTYAIEDPDPVGSLTIGAHGAYYPGFGGNVFGDYVLVDSWWKGHFTVGAQAAFNIYSKDAGYGVSYSDTRICLVPRATYGLNITPQFEVHAGVLLGAAYEKGKLKSGESSVAYSNDGIRLVYGEILGCRFFFTDNFGVSAELNYATYMPYINAGIALRF